MPGSRKPARRANSGEMWRCRIFSSACATYGDAIFWNVPRLGRTEEIDQEKGIDKDLAEVLSMDGLSSSYSIRHLMGRHYLEHLLVFLSADSFLDVWNLPPIDEPPPLVEPPPIEVPPDLVGRERIAFIKQARRGKRC